jgi:hypothetical protein
LLIVRTMNNMTHGRFVAVLSLIGALSGCAVDVPDEKLASEETELAIAIGPVDYGVCVADAIAICLREYDECKLAAEDQKRACRARCEVENPTAGLLASWEKCAAKHGSGNPVCTAIYELYHAAVMRQQPCLKACWNDYESDVKACDENACCGIASVTPAPTPPSSGR